MSSALHAVNPGGKPHMPIQSFDYMQDETLDRTQVVLVSTRVGGTVLHHPDATDDQIRQGLRHVFDAIVQRHGAGSLEDGVRDIVRQLAA